MDLKNINIQERMKHYNVSGLSVTLFDNAQTSVTEYYGLLESGTERKVNHNSIFNACSISKFFTAMLVMKLSEQDLLNLDEDVNIGLVAWKVPDKDYSKPVTLRNLLSHQSGIIDPEDSFPELNPSIGKPSIVELLEGRTPYCNSPITLKYEPGNAFHYSDAGFCIIQQLIEDVMEKPFQHVMNEQIFMPLKMENSTLDINIIKRNSNNFSCGHNKNGEIVEGKYPTYPYPAASGIWTTPNDLAQLVLEFMNALKGESKIGISASKAKEMITPQGGKAWTGLGVFLDGSERQLEMSSLGWGVGFQSMMIALPYVEKGAIIMTNTDLGVHQMKGIIGEIYKSLMF